MYKILVPVDFSEHSEYALEIACNLAKDKKAQIVLIHMIGLSEAIYAKNEVQEYEEARYYMKLAKEHFNKFLDKPYTKGLKINKIIQNYKDFEELNNVVKEQNIDLIVMGSHGTKGLNEVFVGSNTEKVVRTSEVPVLVIKAPDPNFNIKNIVFACDFKEDCLGSLVKINDIANFFSASLQYLYINIPGNKFLSTYEIEERISKFETRFESNPKIVIYDDYNVENGILNYCKNKNVDLIALTTHGRKGISHFFMGSVGEDLANHSTLPVLTIKI